MSADQVQAQGQVVFKSSGAIIHKLPFNFTSNISEYEMGSAKCASGGNTTITTTTLSDATGIVFTSSNSVTLTIDTTEKVELNGTLMITKSKGLGASWAVGNIGWSHASTVTVDYLAWE